MAILAVTVAVALAATACGGGGGDGDGAAAAGVTEAAEVVAIEKFAFSPAQIEVTAGTTVRWENDDDFRHTVTSGETSGPENVPDGRFDEDLPEKGADATVTFDEPGTYSDYCRQHNAMNGTVVVT